MVSFKRISSLLCVCAILCCFIGLAMPVSAASTDIVFFSDTFDLLQVVDENGVSVYVYSNMNFTLPMDFLDSYFNSSLYLNVNGVSSPVFLVFDSTFEPPRLSGLNDDSGDPVFSFSHYDTADGDFDMFVYISYVDYGQSVDISLTNYVTSSDDAVSSIVSDISSVASSSLGLVSSVVSTIVNNPFLLLTVGFFFVGAAVAILGRILGKS